MATHTMVAPGAGLQFAVASGAQYTSDSNCLISSVPDLDVPSLIESKCMPLETFKNLPTADPHVVGAPWLNSHVLTVSAG